MKWPKGIKPNQIRDDVVSATDITASILDLAGIDIPDYMTGMSVLSEDFNRGEVYAARDLWDEVEEKSRAIATPNWKYIRNDKPEIPWDAHQAYLDFYRPAVHVMRDLNKKGNLNQDQKLFFIKQKPSEELYDIQKDPFELNNLVENPEFAIPLEKMRLLTNSYEVAMQPISDIYNPVHPIAVDLLDWVKKDKPELYAQMLAGIEIGFQGLMKEYKEEHKDNK